MTFRFICKIEICVCGFVFFRVALTTSRRFGPVSYTHLDVYKRQVQWMPLAKCQQLVLHKQIPHCIKIEELQMIDYYLKGVNNESISQ